MGIVVLEERNERCCDRCHLVRCNVHIVHLVFGDYREVGLETALDTVGKDIALLVQLHVGKRNELVLFLLRTHIVATLLAEVHLAVLDVTVGGLDESEVVDSRVNAQ